MCLVNDTTQHDTKKLELMKKLKKIIKKSGVALKLTAQQGKCGALMPDAISLCHRAYTSSAGKSCVVSTCHVVSIGQSTQKPFCSKNFIKNALKKLVKVALFVGF